MKDKIISCLMKRMRIEVAVAGIINKGNKVLLTKRSKNIVEGGKWCIPGGHINKWEKSKDAVIREIKEEIGFNVTKTKFLFMHEEFVKRLKLHGVVFVYSINVKGKLKLNWEVSDYKWFNKDEIKNLEIAFTHKNILEKYFGGKK